MLAALLGNPIPLLLGGFRKAWGFIALIASKVSLQGWLGLAASILILIHFGGEARHWRKLYDNEHKGKVLVELQLKTANQSIANLRTASLAAQDENRRVVAEDEKQRAAITQESHDDYQAQLARLRADFAQRMRSRSDQGGTGHDGLSALPAAATGTDGEAVQGAQPTLLDAAETELQLNALIDWVAKQHDIDPNKEPTR